MFDGEIYNVKLRISKEFVKYFENRQWHNTQKVALKKNGGMLLTMDVPISEDFVAWIAHWSDGMTVIEPTELKMRIKNLLETALSRNGDDTNYPQQNISQIP